MTCAGSRPPEAESTVLGSGVEACSETTAPSSPSVEVPDDAVTMDPRSLDAASLSDSVIANVEDAFVYDLVISRISIV